MVTRSPEASGRTADGHGAVGWTALSAVSGLDKVSILDETGHAAYVANLEPSAT